MFRLSVIIVLALTRKHLVLYVDMVVGIVRDIACKSGAHVRDVCCVGVLVRRDIGRKHSPTKYDCAIKRLLNKSNVDLCVHTKKALSKAHAYTCQNGIGIAHPARSRGVHVYDVVH